ncbi:hypothetical protein ABBQ38_007442 [Trebouxia sp. C0009 RCD-2024]
MDRCTVGRAPRDKRHSVTTASSSAAADLDLSEAVLISQGEEFVCPFCHGQSLELETLVKHIDDEHAYHQRSARCPVCNKSTRDMLQHLMMHQRASDEYLCSSPSSQASSSVSRSMSSEWARAARQEEDLLLKLKAASLSGSPSAYKQTSLTDKHGRLKHGAEKAYPPSQADDVLGKASRQSRASKQAESQPKPVVVDTPELRSQFIREILLSALELDRSL